MQLEKKFSVLVSARQCGKDLAISTPILTTTGWKTMGTVMPGDEVYGSDGAPTRVVANSEVFTDHRCYEVEFTDGSVITAGEDHLWLVEDRYNGGRKPPEAKTTRELVESRYKHKRATTGRMEYRYRVRCDAVPDTPAADLPIDPYILGYWLGDGSKDAPHITVGDDDLEEFRARLEERGYEAPHGLRKEGSKAVTYVIRKKNGQPYEKGEKGEFCKALKALGVHSNKHIPEIYLSASVEQRRALLAGLMDSDGTITYSSGGRPRVEFSVTNKQLASDTHRLVRSLGERTTGVKEGAARLYGRFISTRYRITWTPKHCPFYLSRKAARWEEPLSSRQDYMSITDIREVPTVPTRCIQVAAEDHVFLVGENFTPTHNSESLSLVALHRAFRSPNILVLVVSAGEEASSRIIRMVREIASHPLLTGSVIDETLHRVVLKNGSEIRSVPASEKQIRGFTADLLLVDEAAFVSDEILNSAAIPTTVARPDARIILASTPWGNEGMFAKMYERGLDERDPHVKTYRFKRQDAWWLSEAVIEAMRESMSPLQFAAEYEGEFIIAGDAYFKREELLEATCNFELVKYPQFPLEATMGLDWGRRQDSHAIVLAGQMDDYGVNGRPVVVVPYVEISRRGYPAQIEEITEFTRHWRLEQITSETNGVGQAPTEELILKIGARAPVRGITTTAKTKEDCYGKLAVLLGRRALVIPNDVDLLRQMGGVVAEPTRNGGLKIAAKTEATHDDLPDALSLAVSGIPADLLPVEQRDVPAGVVWEETQGGVKVPLPLRTASIGLSWGKIWDGQMAPASTPEENPWLAVYAPPDSKLSQLRQMGERPEMPREGSSPAEKSLGALQRLMRRR